MAKQPSDLQPAASAVVAVYEPARFKPLPENVFAEIAVRDVTPLAVQESERRALADERIAIVPARHLTVRHTITTGAVIGGLWVMIHYPKIAWPVAFLVAVLGGTSIAEQITKMFKGDKG